MSEETRTTTVTTVPASPSPHRELPPEWERWRGTVDTKLDLLPGQLKEGISLLAGQLETMDKGISTQLDQVRSHLAEVETQTTLTNGRVNGHDVRLAAMTAADETQAGNIQTNAQALRDRRYSLNTLLGTVIGASAAVAALGAFLSDIHLI